MSHYRITKRFVDSLEPPPPNDDGSARQLIYRDETLSGFGIRITSGGMKTYVAEARVNGKTRRVSLGRHGRLTAEEARGDAKVALASMTRGKDVTAEKRAARVEATTLSEAFEDYLSVRKNLKPRTVDDYRLSMDTKLADWLDQPLTNITRDMVLKRHKSIGRKSPARANNTMRILRAVFNYALDQYEDRDGRPILTFNPVNRIGKSRGWYEVRRRQSLLRPNELGPWYRATLQLNQETTRDFLHLLLFTGLRRGEASQLTWETVDFEERIFVISDTKNREPHWLPMSTYVEDLLKRRQRTAEKVWVFPSPVRDGPLREPRTAVERVVELSGVNFMLHDLRRTFITIAESLDIPAYALKRLLNHKVSNDVTAGYIVPSVERLREPMERVATYLSAKFCEPQAETADAEADG